MSLQEAFDSIEASVAPNPNVDLAVITGIRGEEAGLSRPMSSGILKDSANAAVRAWDNTRLSFLNTLSSLGADWAEDWAGGIRAHVASNMQIYNRPLNQSLASKFASSATEGLVMSAPAIAASALGLGGASLAGLALTTAGRIGTASAFSTIFAQSLGDAKDEVDRLSNGELTPTQAWGWAVGKSLIQAGSESWFGLETRLGAGLNQAAKAITGKVAAKEGGQLTLEQLGRYAMGRPWVGGLKTAMEGIAKETGEEFVAGSFDTTANQIISGNDISLKDSIAEGLSQAWQAVPSVMSMVGFGAMVKTQERENLKNATLHGIGDQEAQKAKETALYAQNKAGILEVDQTLLQQENDRIQAIKYDYAAKGLLNEQDADSMGEFVRGVSRNLALMERANGTRPNALPIDYIESQLTGLVNVDPSGRSGLNQADMNTLLGIYKAGSTSGEILSFLLEKNPQFASSLNNILDSSSAISFERENKSYQKHLEDLVGKARPDEVSESYRQFLSQKLKERPLNKDRVVLTPQETKKIVPFGMFRELFVQPLTGIKLGLGSYTANIRGNQLVLTPEFEIKQSSKVSKAEPLSSKAVDKQASQIASDIQAEQQKISDELAAKTNIEIPEQTSTPVIGYKLDLNQRIKTGEEAIIRTAEGIAEDQGLPTPVPESRQRLTKAVAENIRLKNAVFEYDNLQQIYDEVLEQGQTIEPDAKSEEAKKEKSAEQKRREEFDLIESKRREKFEIMAKAENNKRPLAQGKEQLKGLYLPDYLLTIFFTGADPSTIVEEWFHHITANQLLPAQFEKILTEAYGSPEEKKRGAILTNETHEKVAASLLNYIKNSNINEPEVTTAFNWLKNALGQTEQNIKDSTFDFKSLVKSTTDEEVYGLWKEAGDAAADSMRGNPPSVENFDTLEEETAQALDEVDEADLDDFLGKPLAQIGIPKEAGKVSSAIHKKARDKMLKVAMRLFPELGQITSLNQLGLDDKGNYNQELHNARRVVMNRFIGRMGRSVRKINWTESRVSKEIEQIKKDAMKEFSNIPDVVDSAGYMASGGPMVWQYLKQAASSTHNMISRYTDYLDTSLRWLGLNNKDSIFTKLSEELFDADIISKRYNDSYSEKAANKYGLLNRYNEVELDGRPHSLDEVMGLYVHTNGQKLNYASDREAIDDLNKKNEKETISDVEWRQLALLSSNRVRDKVSVKAINQAVDYVNNNNQLKDVIEFTQAEMAKIHSIVKTFMKDVLGVDIGTQNGMYIHTQRDNGVVSDDKLFSYLSQLGQEFKAKAGVGLLSPMQERRQVTGEPIRLDYLNLSEDYIERLNHFITHAATTKKIIATLSDSEIRNQIFSKFGEDGLRKVDRMIKQARAALSPNGRVSERTWADSTLSKLRMGVSMAGIGLKPWVTLLNYLSFVSGVGDIGVKAGFTNFLKALMYVTGKRLSKEGGFGFKAGYHPLAGYEPYEKLKHLSPMLSFSQNVEQYEASRRKSTAMDKFVRSIGVADNMAQLAYNAHQQADWITRFSVWQTVFETEKENLMKQGFSEEEATGKAARMADAEAIKYIPVNLSSRKSYFQQTSEMARLWAPFSAQQIQFMNAYEKDFIVPFISAYKMAKGGEFDRLKSAFGTLAEKKKLKTALWSVVIPAVLFGWLQRRRLPDEDELIGDIITYPFGMLPIIGPAMQNMYFDKDNYLRLNPVIILSDVKRNYNAFVDLKKAYTGEKDVDLVKTLANTTLVAGDVLGVPKFLTQNAPKAITDFANERDAEEAAKKLALSLLFGGVPKPPKK